MKMKVVGKFSLYKAIRPLLSLPLFCVLVVLLLLAISLIHPSIEVVAQAQQDGTMPSVPTPEPSAEELVVPQTVDVEPVARDDQIVNRLESILRSTEWFINPEVTVRDGVVFLEGSTLRQEHREWAGNLARSTQDVVAVVNRIQVIERSPWDFTPAWVEMQNLGRATVQTLPLVLLSLVILLIAWFVSRFASSISRRVLQNRIPNTFLRDLVATLLGIPVFLLGLYLVLQVAGLTRLALTLLGGTGIAGLVIGIAFRDIAENFLASVLISTRNPFKIGDWVEVAGYNGLVQHVTTRGTMLMTFDGRYVRIPNAIVYKSHIVNYSVNPQRRLEFTLSISHEDSIPKAQETILHVLETHPAVLKQPEPLVLVEKLGQSSVDFCIYFWYNIHEHNGLKVKSSLIRLTKQALDDGGFTFPDIAREMIFPHGVPVQIIERHEDLRAQAKRRTSKAARRQPVPIAAAGEGDLASEEKDIQAQASQARPVPEGENLLKPEPEPETVASNGSSQAG